MSRSRAALLPHPADPFLLNYWLKFFNNVWGNEVDRLYIYINSPIEEPVINYMRDLCRRSEKIHFMYYPNQLEHGAAIDEMLELCTEEYVMLIEDDGFIFRQGKVDKYFSMLENGLYDIVGSPRGSCSMEIWNASKDKYDLDFSGYGDVGPNFWPCYFFSKRSTLLSTDRNFGAKHWPKGTYIKELDYTVKEDGCYGDTFVDASIQLRSIVPKARIITIPQYHGSPDDLEHKQEGKNLFDGQAFWTHVGSLSSGTHGVLIDDFGRSLARRLIDEPKSKNALPAPLNNEQERNEWERRVQWWLTFWENRQADYLIEFAELYKNAIDRIIRHFALSPTRIKKRQEIYKQLGL